MSVWQVLLSVLCSRRGLNLWPTSSVIAALFILAFEMPSDSVAGVLELSRRGLEMLAMTLALRWLRSDCSSPTGVFKSVDLGLSTVILTGGPQC